MRRKFILLIFLTLALGFISVTKVNAHVPNCDDGPCTVPDDGDGDDGSKIDMIKCPFTVIIANPHGYNISGFEQFDCYVYLMGDKVVQNTDWFVLLGKDEYSGYYIDSREFELTIPAPGITARTDYYSMTDLPIRDSTFENKYYFHESIDYIRMSFDSVTDVYDANGNRLFTGDAYTAFPPNGYKDFAINMHYGFGEPGQYVMATTDTCNTYDFYCKDINAKVEKREDGHYQPFSLNTGKIPLKTENGIPQLTDSSYEFILFDIFGYDAY